MRITWKRKVVCHGDDYEEVTLNPSIGSGADFCCLFYGDGNISKLPPYGMEWQEDY
jgi:hypothetical protein